MLNIPPVVKCGLTKVVALEPGNTFAALPNFATKCWMGPALENRSTTLPNRSTKLCIGSCLECDYKVPAQWISSLFSLEGIAL